MRIRTIGLFSALGLLGLPLAGHADIKMLTGQGSSPLPRATLVESPADPPSYFPLATSTPFLVTNSGTPSGTVAPWAFQGTSSNCGSTNANLLMQWENNSGATPGVAYLLCNGSLSVNGSLVAGEATAPSSTSGSLVSSLTSSEGELVLGGASSACLLDYGVTTASLLTTNCNLSVNGFNLEAITLGGEPTSEIVAVNPSQVLLTNASTPLTIGNAPPFVINSSAPQCADSPATTASIAQFLNGDTPPQSPVIIGCSTNPSDLFSPALNVRGLALFNGVLQSGGNIIATSSYIQAEAGSFGPSLNAGDLGSAESSSTGRLCLGGTSSDDCIDYGVTSSGSETHSQPVVVPNLRNTGLASSTVSPLCGASGTNESQCTLTSYFATTGNANAATGTTANTYQQLGGTQTITTGTSNGPNGKWLVKITMPLNVGSTGLSGENVYGCIDSLSTFTVEDATKDGSNTCVVLPVSGGGIAGTVPFGQASSSGSSPVGLSVAAEADLIVANGTTLAVKFEVAGSTATSATVYGYGTLQAAPF
jgi:hypothetical protein